MNCNAITPARQARPRRQCAGFGWLLLPLLLILPFQAGAGGAPIVLSYTNSTPITINDGYSDASLYPSTIQVPPLPGALQSVTVTLYGLSEPDTSGIELLLTGPSDVTGPPDVAGPNVDLMCRAGSGPATNAILTLEDDAQPFPDTTLISGAYQPSGDPSSDNPFPGYSPFFQEGTNQLDDFIGTTLNGTWNLYEYYDSFVGGSGSISGGWSLSFALLPIAPAVTNQFATNITVSNATLYATVTPELSATTVYFEYGLTTNYGDFSTTNILASDLVDATNVALAITGLPPGTTFHFQAVATNSVGTNFGGDSTFTTPSLPVAAPSLQASISNNSTLILTLSGSPGSNYTVVSAASLSPPITWTPFTNVTLTNTNQVICISPLTNRMEFFAVGTTPPAAPVLAASLASASLVLTLHGNPGSSYAILLATNLSPPITWTTFTNLTMTNTVQVITTGPLTKKMEFFQALQQ